ncbi:MAG: exonuclease subunit SbcC [Cyanophyceae cyanobacterium]
MIPLQLKLHNFLSYRDAVLDFRGLHTACICGANGAGKSSLLEAITWAVWGQSRTATEDDVIHAGENDVRVDFQFVSNGQTYRIIRSRQRGRGSSLDLQLKNEDQFLSLTAKGVRATQQQIIDNLKLDYDTFINSAYLRQGRADEFMLRRPSERKQILADLLKLERYEELAAQAKDYSKQLKGQAEQLESALQPQKEQLEQRGAIAQEQARVKQELQQLQRIQGEARTRLQALQAVQHQRKTWEDQLIWQQTQYQNVSHDCDRLLKEQTALAHRLADVQQRVEQAPEITAGYQHLLRLQQEEEALAAKFQAHQEAQQRLQQLEQQLLKHTNELNLQIQQTQTRLETLEQQEQENQVILNRAEEVQQALQQLHACRDRLQKLDRLQHHVSPLLQQRTSLQTKLEHSRARLTAKLEQVCSSTTQLRTEMAQVPQIRQAVIAVDAEIGELEKKRTYQQRVNEKGQERRSFQQRLQENQRGCEKQWEELRQKLHLLEKPEASCPLCEQDLNEQIRHRVIHKTETQQQEIQEQLWMIREQMAVCERELQVLRAEYAQITGELAPYDSLLQKFGQLEAQLEATGEKHLRLKQLQQEREQLESALTSGSYAQEIYQEIQRLEQELQRLNYDEQTHALVRGEVERWRWAEIKQAKIEEAARRQQTLESQKPKLLERLTSVQQQLEQLRLTSRVQQQIEQEQQTLAQLGYERSHHTDLVSTLRQAQSWQLRYQQLQEAQRQAPQLQENLRQLQQALQERRQNQEAMKAHLDSLTAQVEQRQDNGTEISALEQQIHQRRQRLDQLLAEQGRLEQTLTQLEQLQAQYQETRSRLKEVRKQGRVYQELAQAFGKNGIQALMIENVLPQLEAETNQILSRLTENQLHVQFLTQKAGRSRKQSAKLIDTLEILIADARGTRAYETYSGGEAFRINFSIRLALARLLAQRAGTSLQMLIVDEGFGTQDAEGCDRLIAAINAIAADFSCILTVTHMPQFKEAFQNRIEVYKTNQGSQLTLAT